MSKETRRSRYQKTASTLRYLLNYGQFPAVDRLKYYRGYRAFEMFEDRYGVWLKLMRGDRFIAIIERRYVRINRNTIYRPILENFARRTNRRIVYADQLVPASRRLTPRGQINVYLVGTNFSTPPFRVDISGNVTPRVSSSTEGVAYFEGAEPSSPEESVLRMREGFWGDGVNTVTVPSIHEITLDNFPF